jgi:stage 0 sporulation protein B (sporulation initiation phosphotransferase)
MNKNWTTVEVLRQARHDWLNKIQIIKGNLELNKIDRVKGYIEEIIIETQQDARLSSLKMPRFSELLMTANWNNWTFDCEYEIFEVFEGFQALDELMYQWTYQYFCLLEQQLDPFTENIITICLDENEEMDMRCSFHLQGKLKDQEVVGNFLSTSLGPEQKIHLCECSDNELFFKMNIKFE